MQPSADKAEKPQTPPKKAPHNTVDVKKALSQRLKGVSCAEIAEGMGVSRMAVSKRLKPLLSKVPGYEYRLEYQDKQADILDALAAGIVGSITPKDLKRASLLSKVNSMGVLIDKSRLIRGQSTSNSVSILLARHVHLAPPTSTDREVIELEEEI
jgi:predicted DNA-binding protein YlxM (UPF0122 family)